MKHIISRFWGCLFCLVAMFAMTGQSAFAQIGEESYFSAFPELPIPAHMTENPDSAVRFDQPDGRIITLQAVGRVNSDEVIEFYHKTMPALGWARNAVDADSAARGGKADKTTRRASYTRDKEVLFFEINNLANGSVRVNVLLRPH